jgi:hypothetical protein
MSGPEHLTNEQLIRAIDDELEAGQARLAKAHLAECDGCREQYNAFRAVSDGIDTLGASVPANPGDRETLLAALDCRRVEPSKVTPSRPFAWVLAVAAAIALAILALPHWRHNPTDKTTALGQPETTTFEVDGESFIALPYSNPDLPTVAPHIVEMQIPASSLASAGIVLQPVAGGASEPTVIADVLVGIDGQPMGVHVLSFE